MLFAWKHKLNRYLAAALVLASAAGLNYMLTAQAIEIPAFSDYAQYECTTATGGRSHSEHFKIITLSSFNALALANELCADEHIAKQYAKVIIEWRPRGTITAQNIVERRYDLLLNRKYHMLGLVPEFFDYYDHLLDSSSYSVYWLAHDEKPRLSQSYFADKTVGLLDDFYSQSFYLLPMNSLAKAGINLKESQKRYYPNINALFSAFENREVDLITTPDLEAWNENPTTRSALRLLIEDQAAPASWYISSKAADSNISCHLQDAISRTVATFRQTDSGQSHGENCL